MSVLRASFRLLRHISRQENIVKNRNISVPSTFHNYKVSTMIGSTFLTHTRHCSSLEKNVIKSPYPNTEIPDSLITDFLWKKADRWSELTAVACSLTGRQLKYKELKLLSRKLATSLLKKGFKPGDVVAIVLPNMPEYSVIALGILEAGLTVTTLNPFYTADEIAFQINNSGAVGLFTIPQKLDSVMEAKKILKQNYKDYNLKLRVICTNDVYGNEQDMLPTEVDRYSGLLQTDVDESLLLSHKNLKIANDVAIIPYSSGTTGMPKGVCLTHRNMVSVLVSEHLLGNVEDASNGKQEILPCIVPSFHIYGFTAILLQSFYTGAMVVTLPKFEEKSFLQLLTNYDCTVLYAAPPLILYIGSSDKVTKEHLRSLKFILSGAAPIAETDIMKCIKKSPATVQYKQGYGITELTGGISSMERGSKKYSSIGVIGSNFLVKVVDIKTQKALGPNQNGELCFKGPQIMRGYLNNEEATSEVIDNEGWFHTGDLGYYDNDQHLYITDRLKELIKVKGFQVAPAELEGILRSHPEIEDAGVIGVPDSRKGETPLGFVKIKENSLVTKEDLKSFLAKKVANYKQIDNFVFLESIPKSAAGKILRKELKKNYFQK